MGAIPSANSLPPTPGTLADQVFLRLREAIVSGDLAPGERILEPTLAARFGVSRGPLRDALARLAERHLIERPVHQGARVVTLSFPKLIDLYHAREALEGMACRLAAERAPEATLEALAALLDEHEQGVALHAGAAYVQDEGDLDFHFRIAQASQNPALIPILCDQLYHLMRLYRRTFVAQGRRSTTALREHRAIVDAMRERDGAFAEQLMRRHIAKARRNIEDLYAAQLRAVDTGEE